MLSRRRFLQAMASVTAGLTVPARHALAQGTQVPTTSLPAATDRLGELMPARVLGPTGESVSILGVGGHHLGAMSEPEAEKTVELAIELGCRFFDTAEMYQRGGSERYMGKFLTPKYRDVSYIMTKTKAQDAATARRHLEGSLKNLATDYVDLWQIHDVVNAADVDNRIANGVLDVFLQAREEGKTRHLGFTGHTTVEAHLRMLEVLDERGIALDTCQMPINVVDPQYESFVLHVLPKLVERNYGVIAMKTLAFGQLLGKPTSWSRRMPGGPPRVVPERLTLEEALQFVWSLPIATLVTGAGNAHELRQNIGIAKSLQQLDEAQRQALIDRVADLPAQQIEFYKTHEPTV